MTDLYDPTQPRLVARGGNWRVSNVPALAARTQLLEEKNPNPTQEIPRTVIGGDLYTRMHELVHIALNARARPTEPQNSWDKMLIKVAVEAYALHELQFDIRGAREPYDYSDMKPPEDRIERALNYLQIAFCRSVTENSGLYKLIIEYEKAFDPLDYRILDKAIRAISYQPSNHTLRQQVADDLITHFYKPPKPPEKPPESQEAQKARQEQAEKDQEQQEAQQEQIQQATEEAKDGESDIGEGLGLGKLFIHNHITTKNAGKKLQVNFRAAQSGGHLGYPDRLYKDGKIFKTRTKPSGTILIDGSGSMSWNTQELEKIISKMPDLTVGVYSEEQTDREKQKTLHILARKGRIGTYSPCITGGGNAGQDMLSLLWAIRHSRPPYIFISDNQMWGKMKGDSKYSNYEQYIKEMNKLLRQYRAVVVNCLEDAVNYIQGKTIMGWRETNYLLINQGKLPQERIRR